MERAESLVPRPLKSERKRHQNLPCGAGGGEPSEFLPCGEPSGRLDWESKQVLSRLNRGGATSEKTSSMSFGVRATDVVGTPPVAMNDEATIRRTGRRDERKETRYLLRAKSGDWVRVHYTGRVKDGGMFGSSEKREPVSFVLGEGTLIPGFEQAVLGMAPGEKKTVTLVPEDGYGLPRQDLRIVSSRAPVGRDMQLDVGTMLGGFTMGTGQLPLKVTERTESTVTLDGNHPLAGLHLIFDLELVEIVEVAPATAT